MKTGFIEQNSFKPFDKVNQITAWKLIHKRSYKINASRATLSNLSGKIRAAGVFSINELMPYRKNLN
jgi:hypothetical protein